METPESPSRLFGVRELCVFPSARCAFVQNGRRASVASASERALLLLSLDLDSDSDSDSGPVLLSHLLPWRSDSETSLSFHPSGTWLACAVAAPNPLIRLVPALFLLENRVGDREPQFLADGRDARDVREYPLPLERGRVPTALVWWETAESRSIAIVGDQTGGLLFYALDARQTIGKSFIVGRVRELDVCIDDKEDAVSLLITTSKNRQWHLGIEEKRRIRIGNSAQDRKRQSKPRDPSKKDDNIVSTVLDMIEPKIPSFFSSSSSFNVRNNPIPISSTNPPANGRRSDPEEGTSGTGATRAIIAPQKYRGENYVSFLDPASGTLALKRNVESNEEAVASYKLEDLSNDTYKVLWRKNLIYSFNPNSIKIHSCHLALPKNDNRHTAIWEDSLEEGELVVNVWIADEFRTDERRRTADFDDVDLPRVDVGSCIIVTDRKIYALAANSDPREWLVNRLIEGYGGTERIATALDVRFCDIIVVAADSLLAKRNVQKALTLYRLAKLRHDKIIMRLGSLGMYKDILINDIHPQSTAMANVCFFAHVLSTIVNKRHAEVLSTFIKTDNSFDEFLCASLCAELGLWEALEVVSFQRGIAWLGFEILVCRLGSPCRGVLSALLNKFYTPYIVQESGLPLLKFIDQYCETFDTLMLKKLCIWMCPLQDCFRILIRALATSQPNTHLSGIRRLIRTFFGVVSVLHSRIAFDEQLVLSPVINKNMPPRDNTDIINEIRVEDECRTVISCGNSHWGIVSRGKICLMCSSGPNEPIDVDLDFTGKALSVSCGREHTLILTENGVYSFGDNRFGQLGVGSDVSLLTDINHPVLVGAMKKSPKTKVRSGFAWHDEKVVHVSAGQYHSACVTDRGALYTWGWGIHGQLGHGTIYNEFIPKKVICMLHIKVSYVGCGSCHTAILSTTGDVYLCGNSAFGQMGDSTRQKCNTPIRINLGPSPITLISVGYFHTLALNKNNEIWTWGSSPQKLRLGARNAKRALMAATASTETQDDSSLQTTSSPTATDDDYHLYPTKVDTSNVFGKITTMSAGWHHSSLVDDSGTLYVWGLNLDCQLGTGDRNEVFVPTPIEIAQSDLDQVPGKFAKKADSPSTNRKYAANVACGGDYTVFIKSDGNVYVTGNSCLHEALTSKTELRVVTFKNARRLVRLPKPYVNLQKNYRHVPIMSNFLYQSKSNSVDCDFEWSENPLVSYKSFENPKWATSILQTLYMFIDDDTPLVDARLRALLASLRGDYAESLNLQLNTLVGEKQEKTTDVYLQHSQGSDDDVFPIKTIQSLHEKIIHMSKDPAAHGNLQSLDLHCRCDERKYIEHEDEIFVENVRKDDITVRAVSVTKGVFDVLPDNSKMWTDCINEATTFWIDHELDIDELENILLKSMGEGHAINMASAIFCSKEVDYQKHLSSTFNLELCDKILQSWS